MAKPKFHYIIVEKETVAHARDGRVITVTQADLLARDGEPSKSIYLNRDNATALRNALDRWLEESK